MWNARQGVLCPSLESVSTDPAVTQPHAGFLSGMSLTCSRTLEGPAELIVSQIMLNTLHSQRSYF